MISNFIAVHKIVCPFCNVRQTGVIRGYSIKSNQPVEIEIEHDGVYFYGDGSAVLGIRCSWSKCAQLITGDNLENVTRNTIKSPISF